MLSQDPSLPFYQKDADAFMRIAEARIRSKYSFGPQRRAIAAKMLMRWLERKRESCISYKRNENFYPVTGIIQ